MARIENDKDFSINERYIEALKAANSWLTITEWAVKVSELYPELLERAEKQAAGQKNETTGLREIAARLSSQTSRGAFGNKVEIDQSERPKKIRWVSDENAKEQEEMELEEDLAPLRRSQIIKQHANEFTNKDQYRYDELMEIVRQFNLHFATDFELDHAIAILNKTKQGRHHPNNLQILTKSHNRKKSDSNWDRFTIEDQVKYLNSVIEIQKMVCERMNLNIETEILTLLIERLKKVYQG